MSKRKVDVEKLVEAVGKVPGWEPVAELARIGLAARAAVAVHGGLPRVRTKGGANGMTRPARGKRAGADKGQQPLVPGGEA